jgi:hypothetical protein
VVWDPLSIRCVLDEIGFGESVRFCVNLCFLLDNDLCHLLDKTLLSLVGQYLMLDKTPSVDTIT